MVKVEGDMNNFTKKISIFLTILLMTSYIFVPLKVFAASYDRLSAALYPTSSTTDIDLVVAGSSDALAIRSGKSFEKLLMNKTEAVFCIEPWVQVQNNTYYESVQLESIIDNADLRSELEEIAYNGWYLSPKTMDDYTTT